MSSVAQASVTGQAFADTQSIGDLSNKIALITGASSGLGRAMSQAFAAAGAFIVNADLTSNPPKVPLLERQFEGSGRDFQTPTVDLVNQQFPSLDGRPRMVFTTCDVTSAQSVEVAIAFAVETYGRLDIMVNNAGVAACDTTARSKRTHETDEKWFNVGVNVNFRGVWLGVKYAAAQMLRQDPHSSGDRGWIINISSILGLVGAEGAAIYSATKVLQLTKSCALEYARDRIHVNSIHPGYAETSLLEPLRETTGPAELSAFLTSIHPWGRLALPEDIAKMAVFLAGPGASFCTGAPFVVDGGFTAI